jgi:hypothetical protein
MNKKEIIQIINDLIEVPEHDILRWNVVKKALNLVDKIETEQLRIGGVSGSFNGLLNKIDDMQKVNINVDREGYLDFDFDKNGEYVKTDDLKKLIQNYR